MIDENERTKLKMIVAMLQDMLIVKQDPVVLAPKIATKLIYAADNSAFFYTAIDKLPVHKFSEQWKSNIGNWTNLHMDFGSGTWEGMELGIPITLVTKDTPKQSVNFLYADESDPGEYYIGKREGGTDGHQIAITGDMVIHEICNYTNDIGQLVPLSGAKWDLTRSLKMRPNGWTSADAAGLPIAPFLIRYDEIESGVINHALRMTVSKSRGNAWPASHCTSGKLGQSEPVQTALGACFRLRADFDISKLSREGKIIATAMKTYGIYINDNGSDGFVSGCPDERWNNDKLADLGDAIKIKDLEAVDVSGLIVSTDSYEAVQV